MKSQLTSATSVEDNAEVMNGSITSKAITEWMETPYDTPEWRVSILRKELKMLDKGLNDSSLNLNERWNTRAEVGEKLVETGGKGGNRGKGGKGGNRGKGGVRGIVVTEGISNARLTVAEEERKLKEQAKKRAEDLRMIAEWELQKQEERRRKEAMKPVPPLPEVGGEEWWAEDERKANLVRKEKYG